MKILLPHLKFNQFEEYMLATTFSINPPCQQDASVSILDTPLPSKMLTQFMDNPYSTYSLVQDCSAAASCTTLCNDHPSVAERPFIS